MDKTATEIIKDKIRDKTQEAKKNGREQVYFHFKFSEFPHLEKIKDMGKIREEKKNIIETCNKKGWFGDILMDGFNISYQPERYDEFKQE